MLKRCAWVNLNNPLYVKYHDEEWGRPVHDDRLLFEMLILEIFVAGLSWECVLNKRENFKRAFDNFDVDKIITYDDRKVESLLEDSGIIRNRLKISATINNAKVYKKIQNEFGSFDQYLWSFTNNQIINEQLINRNEYSDKLSNDLKKRGMRFVGTITVYAYLQAIGIINSHEPGCYLEHLDA